MMIRRFFAIPLSLVLAMALAVPGLGQIVVYSNQATLGGTSFTAFTGSTEWDDLLPTGGGLLSELSLITRRSGGGPQFASGFFDLRIFDEAGNFPQGTPLGVVSFSGTFPATPTGVFSDGVLIQLTDLESLDINLPDSGRIGIGVRFDQSGWGLIPSGPAEVGSSPGGNWVGESPTERHEFGQGLPYRVAVVDPLPPGPGVGSYSLFETALATPDHPVQNGGMIGDDQFFPGVGFRVHRTTHLSQVGAYLSGSGSMFAAIVQTSNLYGLPNPPDLSGSDVLATTVIELPGGFDGADVTADFDVTLEPGTYALIFGTDKFGAAGGEAFFRDAHIPNGDWSTYSIRQSDGSRFFQAGAHRFFAIADSAPGTVQVRPTFDTLGEVAKSPYAGEIGGVRLIDGDDSILVDTNAAPDPDSFATMEFSLANVPLDREIRRVTLELNLNLVTTSGPLQFDVLGFAGDDAAQRTDVIGPQTVVGQTSFTSGSVGGIATVDIDAEFVSGLLTHASHLGLTIKPSGTGNFRFHTLESGEFGEPPLLTINLAPPPIATLPGDFNSDGLVDAADYVFWRKNDGAPRGYDEWRLNFGASSDGGSASLSNSAVPEPPAHALALMVACSLFIARRASPAPKHEL
jgi:hypothetical protein